MLRTLKSTAGFFFYFLGITFLLAYLFWRNEIVGDWPLWWMQVAELSLLIAGLTYAASSFFLSMKRPGKKAPVVGTLTLVICFCVLFFAFAFNFWEQWGRGMFVGVQNMFG